MKKVVFYGFILFLCLAGGLTIGIIRKRAKAGGGDLVISTAPTPPLMDSAATSGTGGEMSENGTLGFDDLAASEGEGELEGETETGTEIADAGAATDSATEGFSRTFGGVDSGSSSSSPSRARPSSGSSGSSRAVTETWTAPPEESTSTMSSTASSASSSASSDDDIIKVPASASTKPSMSDPWEAPKKAAAPDPTPMAATEPDPWDAPATATGDGGFGGTDAGLDDLPVIDGAGATAEADPFAATPPAPPSDPFVASGDERVAMIAPDGGGELSFPSASGKALKKVSQRVSGEKTVVHIDMSGNAKFRVFKSRSGKIFVDIEETDVPGGATRSVSGAGPHVKEISARPITNAGGMKLARVQILLKTTEMPNVSHEQVSGGIDIVIGGARF